MQIPPSLQIMPVAGLPEVYAGDDVGILIADALRSAGQMLRSGDVLVVAQKIISKAEGRRIELASVTPSARARELAEICAKDPRLVELILGESTDVVRCRREVLIVQHRLGFIVANAAIDQSNVEGGNEHALLLPVDPDGSARILRATLEAGFEKGIGVVINDSFGRPWRRGTCGVAIGCAGIEALVDLRGKPDRFGRILMASEVAMADEIAAAASLAMGQAAEGIPAVVIRGLAPFDRDSPASELLRPPHTNLFT